MQHEQRLQNLSAGLRLALQAEFWHALFVGALTPAVTGVLTITGSSVASFFLSFLWGNWRVLEFCSGSDLDTRLPRPEGSPFTAWKRYFSIIFFDTPSYLFSLHNTEKRICLISWLVHSCSNPSAICGHFDNWRTSSLFASTLSKRHLSGSAIHPGEPKCYSCWQIVFGIFSK